MMSPNKIPVPVVLQWGTTSVVIEDIKYPERARRIATAIKALPLVHHTGGVTEVPVREAEPIPGLPESDYPWAIGNDQVRLRYVNWKGEGRLFLDTMDERGAMRVFRVALEEQPPVECSGDT